MVPDTGFVTPSWGVCAPEGALRWRTTQKHGLGGTGVQMPWLAQTDCDSAPQVPEARWSGHFRVQRV